MTVRAPLLPPVRTTVATADQFRALKDNYIATRIDDVEAVGNRVLRALMNLPYLSLDNVPHGGIVLAREISPADTALIDPKRIAVVGQSRFEFGGIEPGTVPPISA